jgi:hypothetical protein
MGDYNKPRVYNSEILKDMISKITPEGLKLIEDEMLGMVEEKNPYIEPFLLRNGFEKQKNNSYNNLKCIITVLDGYYQIDWNHIEYGEISTYTDSYSLMHLVGVLTWNNLIDKNYEK